MSSIFGTPPFRGAAARTLLGGKPRVFISYHHGGDQWYYNEFVRLFDDHYDVIEDRSLERRYDSADLDYVRWAVANNDIKGTSCTIVLCGSRTFERKFVDWEIKATLDDNHGLVGIALPSAPRDALNRSISVPSRLHYNIQSRYAPFHLWEELSAQNLSQWIATAQHNAANYRNLIYNPRELKRQNG